MGKKKIIQKSEAELIKENEAIEGTLKKEPQTKISSVKRVTEGKIFISSTFNNTIITLTDNAGNTLAWSSAGKVGFKGVRKSTPYAASKIAETLVQTAQKIGIEKVQVIIKGIGSGRESALRSIATHGLNIASIKDITSVPHGGCRPPKPRRV